MNGIDKKYSALVKTKKTIAFLLLLLGVGFIPIFLLAVQQQQNIEQKAAATGIPSFQHVFVIMDENHSYSEIIGNAGAPYINQLANQYGSAIKFLAISHPSLPNYIAFTSGGTQGISTDCNTCFISANNIFSELETAGKTWKSYHETMPSNCFLNDSGSYVLHHNPAAYYTQLRSSCSKNDVPYSQFAADLASGNVGNFNFIVPNNADNMHSGTIQAGDTWLKNNLPKILASSAYTNNGVVFFTFDEGNKSLTPNQVVTIVMSPLAKTNFKSNVSYNLYSLLGTIETGLGVAPIGAAGQTTLMTDFFGGTPTSGNPSPTMPNGPTINPTGATGSITPSQTPCTTTILPGHTTLGAAIFLHGIGKGGDNANPASTGNTSPQHQTRNATITILNNTNQPVGTGVGCVAYNTGDGFFNGTIDLGTLASGNYLIQVKVPGYLPQQIPGIVQIHPAGQSNIFPTLPHLITSDINNDNQIDIQDYNILIGCFGSKMNASSCTNPPTSTSAGADLNDDGVIDGSDYNVFLRELSVQRGN